MIIPESIPQRTTDNFKIQKYVRILYVHGVIYASETYSLLPEPKSDDCKSKSSGRPRKCKFDEQSLEVCRNRSLPHKSDNCKPLSRGRPRKRISSE